MARHEQDREDLMREATGLTPRAEIASPHLPENLIFGFRREGGLSLFFGADPVYQFNSAGELRRGYVGGNLLKAENGRLAALTRDRQADRLTLWRKEWSDAQVAAFLNELMTRCQAVRDLLESGAFQLVAEVPRDSNAIERLRQFLVNLKQAPRIAQRAHST